MELFHDPGDMASSFRHFGVVSNESLRVGVAPAARTDSFARGAEDGGGGSARHALFFPGASVCRGRKKQQHQQQEQQCNGSRSSNSSRSSGRRAGRPRTAMKSQGQEQQGRLVLFATPQELGDRCVKFIKEQRSRFHLVRRCAVMLACWPKYR